MWTSIGIEKLDKDVDGIYIYNWGKLEGASNNGKEGCLYGAVNCVLPKTETKGKISLSFNDEANSKIVREIEASEADFILTAYGDDDPLKDCKHTGVDINIEYEYFEK